MKTKHYYWALYIAITFIFCECVSNVEKALVYAGDNRPELETVLEHYTTVDADPEKLAAARFLIENMPAHKSYRGDEIHDYYAIAGKVLSSGLTPVEQRDSLLYVSDYMFPGLEDRTIT